MTTSGLDDRKSQRRDDPGVRPVESYLNGVLRRQPDGGITYRSDVYEFAFNRDGIMTSLVVAGIEFLQPLNGAVGGAAFFAQGKRISLSTLQPNVFDGQIGDGNLGVFLHTEADRMDIGMGQETPSASVQYVFFPAEGIVIAPIENPETSTDGLESGRHTSTHATRWTAPDGTAIELEIGAHISKGFNGERALVVDVPFGGRVCGQIRFPGSPERQAQADVTWNADVDDHNFAKGAPIRLAGSVTIGPNLHGQIDLLTQFEDLNTGEVVHTDRQRLAMDDTTATRFRVDVAWEKPGPWRVNVLACLGEHVIGAKSGAVVYDLEGYQPALACPADFWKFWEDALAAQRSLPLAPHFTRDEKASTPELTAYTVYINGYRGRRLQGFYYEPVAPGRFPVTLGAVASAANRAVPNDNNVCSLISIMDGMATYRTGLGNRETSNLFYNYIDALRWVDFLAACPKADLNRSVFSAGSRSGPIGIAVLALDPRVKMYIATVPTNNRWDWQVTLPGAGGWGPWAGDRAPGQSMDDYVHQLSYFNPDNFAARISQPCMIGFGLLDDLSQVTGNLACFARLGSNRKIIFLRPWHGHSDPSQAWKTTAEQWREELFNQPMPSAPRTAGLGL